MSKYFTAYKFSKAELYLSKLNFHAGIVSWPIRYRAETNQTSSNLLEFLFKYILFVEEENETGGKEENVVDDLTEQI